MALDGTTPVSRRGVLRGTAMTAAGGAVLAAGGTGLLAGLTAAPAFAAGPSVGAAAPAFAVTDTAGRAVSLEALKGKVVVLEWTNHECPFVKKHYGAGNMQALQKDLTGKGAVWLTVVSSAPGEQGHVDAAKADALATESGAAHSHKILDPQGTLGKLYAAKTTPHMYVVDPTGVLRYDGAIDSIKSSNPDDIAKAEPWFRQAAEAVLAGQPVANATTKPYGCGVKYAKTTA